MSEHIEELILSDSCQVLLGCFFYKLVSMETCTALTLLTPHPVYMSLAHTLSVSLFLFSSVFLHFAFSHIISVSMSVLVLPQELSEDLGLLSS